ncbi:uncharacterized protein TNCV_1686971 [Trichonephila clavipes]|nr:uncharacterized protein TNCV_1686971 [Trichonephila clavipes]
MMEKLNWEVYKTQFCIISEANGWTEEVKSCQLAASLRGETAEVLQTLSDTERQNLNSLYNALDLCFGQKYSRTTHVCSESKTPENLREYASEYFVDGLKNGEIQTAVRVADVQDLKYALLYAPKLEAATQDSRRDRRSIHEARVTADEPCESRLIQEMEKLKEEMQTI